MYFQKLSVTYCIVLDGFGYLVYGLSLRHDALKGPLIAGFFSSALAEDIQDMMAAIYGLADLLEQDGSNEGSEEEAQMLGRFHRGCMVTAIKHLANRANSLTDIIQDQEAFKTAGAGGDV